MLLPLYTAEEMRRKLWAFALANTLRVAMRHHKRAGEKAAKNDATVASTQEAAP